MDYKILVCMGIILLVWYIYKRYTTEGFKKRLKKAKNRARKVKNNAISGIKDVEKRSNTIGKSITKFAKNIVEKCYICRDPKDNDGDKHFCKRYGNKIQKLDNTIYDMTTQLGKIQESIDNNTNDNYDIDGLITTLDDQTEKMVIQSATLEGLIEKNNNITGYLEKNNVLYGKANTELDKDNQLLNSSNEIYM